MLRWTGTCFAAALAINAAARTETGTRLAARPIEQMASMLDAASLGLRGISEQRRTHLAAVERISEFRNDDPVRELAHVVGLLWVDTVTSKGERALFSCTATVISVDRILTNSHCLEPEKGATITKLSLWLNHTKPDAADSYDIALTAVERDPQLDFAILVLLPHAALPVPRRVALNILRDAIPGERLMIIHHAGGEVQQITRAYCRAAADTPIAKATLTHTCATSPGSSGALVFAERDGAIVGLHKATRVNAHRQPGLATTALAIIANSPTLRALSSSKK